MTLVKLSKQCLQTMRDDGWELLFDELSSFCEKYNIIILNIDNVYVVPERSRRNAKHHTNIHHYRVELFY